MEFTMEFSGELLKIAGNLEKWTTKILKEAKLSAQQRMDLEAVSDAIQRFQTYASDECFIIDNSAEADPQDLQRVRHQLLNHLNIIAGFTRIIVRELPDNLLLQMVTIRKINETGQTLIDKVKALR
jgi:hypothetical protein